MSNGDSPQASLGDRFNEGKLRWSLFPFQAAAEIVKVLTFGATKYTKRFQNEWEGLWNVTNAKKLELFVREECVAVVMKNGSGKLTLHMQKNKEPTLQIGVKTILTESDFWKSVEEQIKIIEKKEEPPALKADTPNMESLQILLRQKSKEVVSYAEQRKIFTLITTTQVENTEVSCVVNTTTVLASLETTLQELRQPLNILEGVTLREISGKNNWQKGLKFSETFESLQRHVIAWYNGEDKDAETGCSHLAHAGCNILFLLWFTIKGRGIDDRPNFNVKDKEYNPILIRPGDIVLECPVTKQQVILCTESAGVQMRD